MESITVSIDYLKNVNYALVHNHKPFFRSVTISNNTGRDLENIQICIDGKYLHEFRSDVYSYIKHGTTKIIDDLTVCVDADALLTIEERVASDFRLSVMSNNELVHSEAFGIDIMAYDQWLGSHIMPEMLASFCVPNLPAVKYLISKAATKLQSLTGSPNFLAYQDGSVETVMKQVAAVFAALHAENIIYKEMTPSFEQQGQRIALPDMVLQDKMGNCIELTLLMASCLENIGIHSGVVLTKGHAFLGVWLEEESYSHSICDDSSYLEKKCSEGINEMMLVECTTLTQQNASFEQAQQAAKQHLLDMDKFDMFVDIYRCRLEGIIPLPIRTSDNGVWKIEMIEGVEHAPCDYSVKKHTKYDLDNIDITNEKSDKVDIWERKLLDFTLRNNFLNLSLRYRALQFITFNAGMIEDYLQEGKEYLISHKPNEQIVVDRTTELVRSGKFQEYEALVANDVEKEQMLHSYATEKDTTDVLRRIYRSVRTSIEETGSNTLYLAIGVLRWYEKPNSPKPRYAPILLMPVEMVYKRGHYYIRKRDEELSLNITLTEYLRQNFNIRLKNLDKLPNDEHGIDVQRVFAYIRDGLQLQEKWDIEEECVLGTFSFNKFLMWNDIHSNRSQLMQNNVVKSLVEGGLTWSPQPISTDIAEVDNTLAPSELCLPVDVDSSQMAAVLEAGRGSSYILFGPPGTGKSQTITNLISNALFKGKRVLFVAEKMAALSVVQNRLAKIGLDPFCLELHSNKATKKHVLEQMAKALAVVHTKSPKEYEQAAQNLFEKRKTLINYIDALHRHKDVSGFTLYDCIQRYESLDVIPYDIVIDTELSKITYDEIKRYEEELYTSVPAVLKFFGQVSEHPLVGIEIKHDAILQKDRLVELLKQEQRVAIQISKYRQLLTNTLSNNLPDTKEVLIEGTKLLSLICHCGAPTSEMLQTVFEERKMSELGNICAELSYRDSHRARLLKDNSEEMLKQDVSALSKEWFDVTSKWFIPRFFAKRSFVKKLKYYNSSITSDRVSELLKDVQNYQREVEACKPHEAVIKDYMGTSLNVVELKNTVDSMPKIKESIAAFSRLTNVPVGDLLNNLSRSVNSQLALNIDGCEKVFEEFELCLSQIDTFIRFNLSDSSYSDQLVQLHDRITGNMDKLDEWFKWSEKKRQMVEMGLSCVVKMIETTAIAPEEIADRFFKGYFKAIASRMIVSDKVLCLFEGSMFDQQVALYTQATRLFQELSKQLLVSKLASQVPLSGIKTSENSEIALLNRAIANGGRGISIRQLLDQIPNILNKVCPCFLMSPMSVAQYIDLNQQKFDLVIFDEASQMPTSEAVGAIARGNALIVVGDPKQMPPTSFFSTNNINEDDEDIDDLESILQECQALNLPSLQLNWHYRSRHESLIAFSNHEYYEDKLITFPSIDDQQNKVSFVPIDGVYDKGGKRTNRAEAEAIVNEVVRRLKTGSTDSIGIIAFSATQQNLIEDILNERIDNDSELSKIAMKMEEKEGIFVKNLENVQGDERDIILFSIGYGPDAKGHVSMNFGPLNKVGGERRLNVAVSRARKEMMVFSTMRGSQIDINRTNAKGVEGLKKFLEYAEKHLIQADKVQSGNALLDMSVTTQIAKALKEHGYEVRTHIGRSQFKVNVAVVNPDDKDKYILGILLDGNGYRNTQTTRDREIVQPTVLNGLQWNIFRVWSIDWFRNRNAVVSRIEQAIKEALNPSTSANDSSRKSEEIVVSSDKSSATSPHTSADNGATTTFGKTSTMENDKGQDTSTSAANIESHCDSTSPTSILHSINDNTIENAEKSEEPEAEVYQSNAKPYPIVKYKSLKPDCQDKYFIAAMQSVVNTEQPINHTLLCKRMANILGLSRVTATVTNMVDSFTWYFYVDADRDNEKVYWINKSHSDEYAFYRPNSGSDSSRSINEIPSIEIENAIVEVVEQSISIPADDLTLATAKVLGFARRGTLVDSAISSTLAKLLNEGKLQENNGRIKLNL